MTSGGIATKPATATTRGGIPPVVEEEIRRRVRGGGGDDDVGRAPVGLGITLDNTSSATSSSAGLMMKNSSSAAPPATGGSANAAAGGAAGGAAGSAVAGRSAGGGPTGGAMGDGADGAAGTTAVQGGQVHAHLPSTHAALAASWRTVAGCPICCGTIREAFVTACGHSFCYACITRHLGTRKNCPVCRGALTKEMVHPNFQRMWRGSVHFVLLFWIYCGPTFYFWFWFLFFCFSREFSNRPVSTDPLLLSDSIFLFFYVVVYALAVMRGGRRAPVHSY
jgi:hypothetical protein